MLSFTGSGVLLLIVLAIGAVAAVFLSAADNRSRPVLLGGAVLLVTGGNIVIGLTADQFGAPTFEPTGFTGATVDTVGLLMAAGMVYLAAIALVRRVRPPLLSDRRSGRSLWLASLAVGGTQIVSALFSQSVLIGLMYLPVATTLVYASNRLTVPVARALLRWSMLVVVYSSLAVWLVGMGGVVELDRRTPLPVIDGRLIGVLPYPNALGAIAAVAVLATVARPRPRFWRIHTGAAVICLLASDSLTALIGLATGLAVLWMYRSPLTVRRRAPAAIIAIAIAIVIALAMPQSDSVNNLTGRRNVAWPLAVETWLQSPLVGSGPNVFGEAFREVNDAQWVGSAHNQLLQGLAETGVIGTMAIIAYLLVLLISGKRGAPASGGLSLALASTLLVRALTDVPLRLYYWSPEALVHLVVFLMILTALDASRSSRPGPADGGARPLNASMKSDSGRLSINSRSGQTPSR